MLYKNDVDMTLIAIETVFCSMCFSLPRVPLIAANDFVSLFPLSHGVILIVAYYIK